MKASALSLGGLLLLSFLFATPTVLADRGRGGGHGSRGHPGAAVGHPYHYGARGRHYAGSTVVIGSLWYPFGYPFWGYPYSGYPYYGYPYYAYPPAVYDPLPDYSSSATAQPPRATWYYCPEAKTYYPYVSECPKGWESVPATPPDTSPSEQAN